MRKKCLVCGESLPGTVIHPIGSFLVKARLWLVMAWLMGMVSPGRSKGSHWYGAPSFPSPFPLGSQTVLGAQKGTGSCLHPEISVTETGRRPKPSRLGMTEASEDFRSRWRRQP